MSFGVKCITIPSTKMMSGDLSRSNVFYPDAEALIANYKGRDQMVAWMDVYTENIGSDNYFAEGWYEVKGKIPYELMEIIYEYVDVKDGKDCIELNQVSLDLIRKWKYDN